jgi:hypothetical protein
MQLRAVDLQGLPQQHFGFKGGVIDILESGQPVSGWNQGLL